MKRMTALCMAAAVTLSMTACSSGSNGQSTETTAPAASSQTETTAAETKAETAATETTAAEMTASAEKEEVEITFWHAMSGVNEEAIQKITDDFTKEYPHIKVTLMNR